MGECDFDGKEEVRIYAERDDERMMIWNAKNCRQPLQLTGDTDVVFQLNHKVGIVKFTA